MKRISVVFCLLSFILLFFVSCEEEDDKYSLDKYYQSIVVIEGDAASGSPDGSYWLKMTNGDLLWPVNQAGLPVYGGEVGTRGLATYNLVGGADGRFSNLIRLIGISGILTKDIIVWTKENADTTVLKQWNPGVIVEAWLEKSDSTYLNVLFEYRAKKNVMHYINLVQDELSGALVNPSAGIWDLKFCQNSNGGLAGQGNKYRMLVSFFVPGDIDITELSKINIRYVGWNSADLDKVYSIHVGSDTTPSFVLAGEGSVY